MPTFATLPTPPSDYGYLVLLLVALLSVGGIVVGYLYRSHTKYRDDQDAKSEARWKEENAARIDARQRFEAENNRRFDKIDTDVAAFFGKLSAINEDQSRAIESIRERILRLELGKKPPREGE